MSVEKIRLLLLEDDLNEVRRMRAALREDSMNQYEVRQVGTLAESLVYLSKKTPDIILVNLSLPDSQGLVTIKRLQSQAPQTPIIALVGQNDTMDVKQALQAGAQDFLSKGEISSGLLRRAIGYAIERKSGIEQLNQNEERFRLMFENAPVGYQSLDANGCFLDVNDAWLEMLGYTRDEVVGHWFGDFLHPGQVTLFKERFAVAMESHQVLHDIDFTMRRKDGTNLDSNFTVRVARDEAGRFVRTHCALQDVTSRKNTEQAILLMADTQKQIAGLKSMPEVYELMGSRIQALIGDGYVAVSRLDEPSQNMQVTGFYGFGDLYEGLTRRLNFDPFRTSFPVAKMSPEVLQLFRSGHLELTEGGLYNLSLKKVPKRICSMAEKELKLTHFYSMGFVWGGTHHGGLTILAKRDLASYKELIESTVNQATLAIQRIQSEEDLRASEKQYRLLAENIQDVIWVMDLKENRFIYISPSVYQLRGYTVEEVLAAPVTAAMTSESAQNVQDWLAAELQALTAGNFNNNKRSYNVEQTCKDGSTVWTEVSTSIIVDEKRVPTQLIGVSRDISSRKWAELELQNSHSLLATTIESTADGILVVDREGHISLTNQKFAEMWGIPRSILDTHDDATALDYVVKKLKEPQVFIAKVQELYATPDEESFDEIEFKDGRIFERVSQPQFQGEAIVGRVWIFRDVTSRKQDEALQQSVYQIALATETTRSLEDLYPTIHQIISSVMPSENFYITLYDEEHNVLRFPYFKDEVDEPYMGVIQPGKGLTSYVLRTGKSLLCTQQVHDELERKGEIVLLGVPSAIWLGVPLMVEGKAIGVMVVQHYSNATAYGEREQHMLEFVSTQVAIAISRKQSEERLLLSEERFKQISENAGEWIWEVDAQGLYTFTSPMVEQKLGYSADEIVGRKYFYDFFAPEVRLELKEAAFKAFAVKQPFKGFVNPNQHKDGRIVILETNGTPILDQDGNLLGYRGADIDITERKRAEQALYESETQYRTLVEQLPAIVYIDDATAGPGHTVYVGPQIETILGITPAEWMQGELDVWTDHIQPADRERVLTDYMRCYQEGEPMNTEYSMVASDGRLVWFLDHAIKLHDENGKPTYIHGVMYDITERKQAEALQQSVYRIALAAETSRSLDDLYPILHEIIASVMPSENFYITLYDEKRNVLQFPYFKDQKDEPFIGEIQPGQGLTAYVLRTGKSLLCTQQLHDELEQKGEVKLLGVPSAIWLGVPLLVEGKAIGAMVVQHYSDANAYGEREKHMLEFVSTQVAVAISRKQAEEALFRSESELRALFTAMPDLILVLDKDGRYIKIGPGNSNLLYQPADHLLGKTIHEVFPIDEANLFLGQIRVALDTKQTVNFEYKLQTGGESSWFSGTVSPMTEDSVIWIARDITENKRTEDLILESEAKYRSLFDNVPDGVYRTTPNGQFLTVNQSAVKMLGYSSVAEIMNSHADQFYKNSMDRNEFIEMMEAHGEVHNLEVLFRNKEGKDMVLLENARAFRNENGQILYYEGTLTDITDRKHVETERQTLLEIMQGLMVTDDLRDYLQVVHQAIAKVIYAENFFVILKNKETGLFEQTYLVDHYDEPVPPSELGKSLSAYVFRTAQPFLFDQTAFDALVSKGEVEQVGASSPSWLGVPLNASRETIGVMVIQDYETEDRYNRHDVDFLASIAGQVALAVKRKYAETELARLFESEKRRVVRLSELQDLSADLNSLHTERELLNTLVRRTALLSNSLVSTVMLLDETTSEVILAEHTGLPENVPSGIRIPIKALPEEVMVFQKGQSVIVSDIDRDLPALRRILLHPDIKSFTAFPLTISGRVVGVITISGLETHNPSEAEVNIYQLLARLASAALENVRLFENINRSLKRMGSLRRVDMAISSSFDLMLTLNILLEQVTTHLEVDAADILLFDSGDSTLKYTCGRGFHGQALKFTNLRLGEGYAGRAALERRTIYIPNIQEEPSELDKSTTLGSEEFVSYWGVPLLGKGHIQGVLEVFHREPIQVDQEWLDFLETLAGQAAIAIDNVHLFDTLERSNADLSMAYDNTLAGWASALEMRDNETEGHTRRVAAMTMTLAGRLGMRDQEIMFLRWGSLLHDIGKMGIPDKILLKPGPLTESEWTVMRKHPRLAYEMLAPIAYLREALDIPYCHHEKWDGSGYPRGLKGEQIPLGSRIFAIIDVWDALTSDRPYRKAWTPAKTLKYIKEQDGTHFDPRVVKAFLDMVKSESLLLGEKKGMTKTQKRATFVS